MPERQRLTAWKALKRAAKVALHRKDGLAFRKLAEAWRRFPECLHDTDDEIPAPRKILAIIRKTEEALAMGLDVTIVEKISKSGRRLS